MNETWESYWNNFANVFAYPLKANELLGQFVKNTAVTGAYAEAWIMQIAKSMLPQYRISTGVIIRASDKDRDFAKVPQLDLIVWDPSELPALFEIEDFALVPNFSARAIIEVKRSCSDIRGLREQMEIQKKCLLHEFRSNIFGVVISHNKALFDMEVSPEWLKQERSIPAMTRLLDENNEVDVDGMFAFIYFLSQIAGRGAIPTPPNPA